MNRFLSVILAISFSVVWLTNCQSDHLSPEIPETITIQSASLVPPTIPGPGGAAYGMQTGNQCFLLDKQGKFWQYDPLIRSFAEKSSPRIPDFSRDNFLSVDLFTFSSEGKIYLGGQSKVATPGSTNGFPAFFFIYDPVRNTWTAADPCPGSGKFSDSGRISFFASGKGYVCFFGNEMNNDGSINYDKYTAHCYEYDPAKAQWSLGFNTPVPLPDHLDLGLLSQAVTLNNKGYWVASTYLKAKRYQSLTSDDIFSCIFEFDPQTNQLTLKLVTNVSSDTGVPVFIPIGVSAVNRAWFISSSVVDKGAVTPNQVFSYNPVSNKLIRTSASLIAEPNKALSGFVGYAVDNRLYVGMGDYSLIDGTPGGPVNGFAQFDL